MFREQILDILKNRKKTGLTQQEIAQELLALDQSFDLNEIYKTIVAMENDYELIRVGKDKIQSVENLGLILGVFEGKSAGFGFVKSANFDIHISADKLNGAIDKDKVLVQIEKDGYGSNKEGKIYRVLEHGYKVIIGNVINKKGSFYVKPDDKNLNFLIKIKENNLVGAGEGHKVTCYLTETDQKKDLKYGKIKKIIGHIDDPGIDLLAIIYKYDFDPEFSDEAVKEATALSKQKVSLGNRCDLRNLLTITIDGADAKDLDDAISLEINNHNNYVLYVHIADVAHYVQEKTQLDKEAYARGTSVYLANKVVPMLPHQLSNGICSLLPEVDRLTQTCKMEFDDKGKIINYEIFESIINSNYRMTYPDVNKILAGDKALNSQYHEISAMLFKMLSLSKILRKNKVKRGMLDFNIPEPKIIVDDNNQVIDVALRERGDSEKIIEDFMIVANETVAQHVYWLDLPFIYRVHENPIPDKIKDFMAFVGLYDIKIKGSLDRLTSKDIQKLLDEIKQNHELVFLERLLLRCMAKAKYQTNEVGHFGLASKYYTHFTSPIRRYPDLIVHRLLRKYLYNNDDELIYQEIKQINERLIKQSEKVSQKERDAIGAEREVTDLKMAEYMLNNIGKEYEAIISGMNSFGLFVELDNTIEGLIHVSTLIDDYYVYNERFHIYQGQRTNKQYKLGQKVKVIVDGVRVNERQIDFRMAK